MKKIIALVTFLIPILSFAQTYSIDWSKIAGGGGTSSGGNYSLTGTIGQHDAGTMSGGNYTLEGGFLSGIVAVQTTGAPLLSVQLSGVNAVISWPLNGSTGFVLQESATMITNSWTSSSAAVSTNNGTKSVTVSAAGIKFYRLQKP